MCSVIDSTICSFHVASPTCPNPRHLLLDAGGEGVSWDRGSFLVCSPCLDYLAASKNTGDALCVKTGWSTYWNILSLALSFATLAEVASASGLYSFFFFNWNCCFWFCTLDIFSFLLANKVYLEHLKFITLELMVEDPPSKLNSLSWRWAHRADHQLVNDWFKNNIHFCSVHLIAFLCEAYIFCFPSIFWRHSHSQIAFTPSSCAD